MKKILFIGMSLSIMPLMAQKEKQQILPEAIQIKTAVLPLPDQEREGAKVYGYAPTGELVVLREGTNNMVCLADDPQKEDINVSCYFAQLDPFMARGRELAEQGKSVEEIRKTRGDEIAAGQLKMPGEPSMLYVYSGKTADYDPNTGELKNGKFRYVLYTPFATTESTGLPDKPHAPGMPWLMDPGTHRAHIMIGPFQ